MSTLNVIVYRLVRAILKKREANICLFLLAILQHSLIQHSLTQQVGAAHRAFSRDRLIWLLGFQATKLRHCRFWLRVSTV